MINENWEELADLYGFTSADLTRNGAANPLRVLWERLESRGLLGTLPHKLEYLGLHHLAHMLREMASDDEDPPTALPPPPQRRRDLDTLFFDLDDVRHALLNAAEPASAGTTVFALPHVDPAVGVKIFNWLPYCFAGLVSKPKLTLGPLVTSVNSLIARLRGFREALSATVGCHVDARRAPTDAITSFYDRLCHKESGPAGTFVILLTVAPGVGLPEGIVCLPSPVIRKNDVRIWAQRTFAAENWPDDLHLVWTRQVHEYALDENDTLAPGRVYEMMELSIQALVVDPDGYRHELEQGRANA